MKAAKKAAVKVERPVTLHDHIRELRTRLFFVAIIFIGASVASYQYKDQLIKLLLKPLGDQKLYYLNPGGAFQFVFQITIYVGIAAAIPFLIYNLYRFVAPALPEKAQRHSFLVLVSSLLLLICGVLFGYIYAIPGAINFLNNFGDGLVTPMLTGDSYLSFILAYTSGLGILFQLPLVLLFIHWVHPLKPTKLLKFERYMLLISFVIAAIVTPTSDIVNLCIIAAPIILMYQVGVIAVSISAHNMKKQARRAEKVAARRAAKEAARQPAPLPTLPTAAVSARPIRIAPPVTAAVAPAGHVQHAMMAPKPARPVVSLQPTPHMSRPSGRVSIDGIKPRGTYVQRPPVVSQSVKPMAVHVPERRYTIQPLRRVASIDGISIIS